MHPTPSDLGADLLAPQHTEPEPHVLAVRLGTTALPDLVDEAANARHDHLRGAVGVERGERGQRALGHRLALFIGERPLAGHLRGDGHRALRGP